MGNHSRFLYNQPMTTVLTQQEITGILTHYNLGTLLAHAPLTAGTVETNIRLTTTAGEFVLRVYENRTFHQVLFECAVLEHLAAHEFPAPRLFRSRTSAMAGTIHDRPYALFSFIEGDHANPITPAQRTQLIEQIALLHRATHGFQPPHTADRWNYDPSCLVQLAEAEIRKINDANAQLKLTWYQHEIAQLVLPDALPRGVVHADFDASNILFKDGNFAALIDFDDANYTVLLYDIAAATNLFIPAFDHDTWMNFAPDANVFDFTALRETVQIYQHIRPLNTLEQQHLFDACKLAIFVDCLWFYARGDAADFYERRKIDFLNRLGRERFTGAVFG